MGSPIAAELLSDEFRQEEIESRAKTPLFCGRLSPYDDGERNWFWTAAPTATRLLLKSRTVGGGAIPAA